ncbi:hypothetical protein [Singulisphaera sp. PoT]|uniref:hypothetical protein n=1 Tax=Singulisphaera sp. PoT TaxID=3411797 RepID=UPI003BF5430D
MFYKTVMFLGVISLLSSAFWFYRVFAGLKHLTHDDILPMTVGGVAGGIGAWYFVPWLMKREAARRQAMK